MFSALHTVKITNKRVAKNHSQGQRAVLESGRCKMYQRNLSDGLENPMRKRYPVEGG